VSASDRKTGKENKITVATSPERLTEEQKSEAMERSEAAWDHPEREQQLKMLIKEAELIIQESKDKDTRKLESAVKKLRKSMSQDKDKEELSELEDEILDEIYELES